jgi:hypothetical protein
MSKAQVTLAQLPGGSDHDHADWLIGPVGQSRDSETIEESNFRVALARFAAIDPEGNDHEEHRFGHWAVGWIDEIATRPGSACAKLASEMRESLESYAILDELDLSELEAEYTSENLPVILSDLRRALVKVFVARNAADPAPDALVDWLDDMSDDDLYDVSKKYGEESDGWIKYSSRDVEKIADKLAE